MKIARCATLDEIGPSTWPAFAADVGLGAPFVRRRVKALAGSVQVLALRIADQTAAVGLDSHALTT